MQVLLTGAAGMLGLDVQAAALTTGHQVAGVDRRELDITDQAAVRDTVLRERPDVVINCAAYTDVDGAEREPERAQVVNGSGAGNVAAAAQEAGAWMIHVSTDYVFDGAAREPYVESDAVGPASAYGRSKLAGERAVATVSGAHTIVRTSWLFGAGGSCFPATILRLAAERETLTVVADQIGCPTFTGHLATALLDLCDRRVPGILHVAGGGQCSWYEFARELVSEAGLSCDLQPVSTAQFPRPAPRPAWSVLGTERRELVPALPDWRQGLRDYMELAVSRA